MLTWVIVKARVDSSLNLYEHCVACDNENNCCPAGPALRGQPCGATLRGRLPCLPCILLIFGSEHELAPPSGDVAYRVVGRGVANNFAATSSACLL